MYARLNFHQNTAPASPPPHHSSSTAAPSAHANPAASATIETSRRASPGPAPNSSAAPSTASWMPPWYLNRHATPTSAPAAAYPASRSRAPRNTATAPTSGSIMNSSQLAASASTSISVVV